jgi:hypothetical protein
MEILCWGSGEYDMHVNARMVSAGVIGVGHVSVVRELKEALQTCARVFWPRAIEPMWEQEHKTALSQPFCWEGRWCVSTKR